MRLTDEENSILDSSRGEAARVALSVLVDLGTLYGAEELMKVSQVHIDATLYMVAAGLEFAERMVEWGGTVAVPTSLNPSAIDLQRWKAYRVPVETLPKHKRLEAAYLNLRATPTWTCAPYQHGLIPRFGEQIAWGESNAIAFANYCFSQRGLDAVYGSIEGCVESALQGNISEGIMVAQKITGCGVVPGIAKGEVLVTSESISFWAALILPPAQSMIRAMHSSGRAWRVKCWYFPLAKARVPARSLCWNWSGWTRRRLPS